MNPAAQLLEVERCQASAAYFTDRYGSVKGDGLDGDWRPFRLWPGQREVFRVAAQSQRLAVLKARQLGLSWLFLHDALHTMLFRAPATVLLFSLRDEEAMQLLGRLKDSYARLPEWLRCRRVLKNDMHEFRLSNGSMCKAFPTSAGDSYTAQLAIVDEADLVPDLGRLLGRVKPTVDAGGRLVLVSRSDKSKPLSVFKQIYRSGRANQGGWQSAFLPWHARPDRDAAWYSAQVEASQAQTGSLDFVQEQYPATDEEALSPATLSRRLPPTWLDPCYQPSEPLLGVGPTWPTLVVYREPVAGRRYVIGVDPAEGLIGTSDESAVCVLDAESGEQVAELAGWLTPADAAKAAADLALWFHAASVLVERNNHGHAVLQWLELQSPQTQVLNGPDERPGWLTSRQGKSLLYDALAEALRARSVTVRSAATYGQLASIQAGKLAAPPGLPDDRATAFALAVLGRFQGGSSVPVVPEQYLTPAPLAVPQKWTMAQSRGMFGMGGGK